MSLRPIEPPRWDHGIAWGQFLLEGDAPVPRGCRGSDPLRVWPEVEAKLGHGIGWRRARFLIVPTCGKSFAPPSWWLIEEALTGCETFDDHGKPTGWHWQEAKAQKDGSFKLARGWALKFTVMIEGRPAGLDEGAAYALEVVKG